MAAKQKILKVDLGGWSLHNGEGRPDLQFPDPVNGDMIGGQEAALRMAMRYRYCVLPWARRTGKSTFRQALFINEAAITSGMYYAFLILPEHATAFKVFEAFRKAWGGLVKDSKGDDKNQDRWIELHPNIPPGEPPTWFTPHLKERWHRCQNGEPNAGAKIYFFSGRHPHYFGLQGYLHPFHRGDVDESQQVHPGAYIITEPMLDDIGGFRCITGTPWSADIGNVTFEDYWNLAVSGQPDYFAMRIPHGANPHVKPVDIEAMRKRMSDRDIAQLYYARFLTDAGAVFSNLDAVFILKPLDENDASLDWIRALRSKYAMPSMSWWVHESAPRQGHIYGASIDWARSPKGDYSVLTVFDFSTGKQVALLRWRGENFPEQMEVVLAVQKHYGAQQLHADANGMGEPMADFMRRRHALGFVGHKFTSSSKPMYVRQTQVLFREASFSLIACNEQRKEFKDFSVYEAEGLGSEKQVKYCAPEGKHDDMVAAVMQLAPTLTITGRQAPEVTEEESRPGFDDKGQTTLSLFGADPYEERDGEDEWRLVSPERRR